MTKIQDFEKQITDLYFTNKIDDMFKRYLLFLLLLLAVGCTNKGGKNYTSLNDACSDKIGVLMGSTQDMFITKTYPEAKIVRLELVTDLISSLKSDKCDVIIITSIQADEVLKADPELKTVQHDVCSNPMGVGFGKGNQALKEAFNLFLSEIKKDGLYDEIVKRWTTGDENAKMPEILLPTKGTPLRIGTTATSSPYSFEKNGVLSGLDIELISRFAAHMNRPVKFLKMNFAGLIPALISDKLDIIVNCIMITPERAKKVDFSDSYFNSNSVAIAMSENVTPASFYRDINDLSEKRISVLLSSTQDAYVTKTFPKATILRANSITDMFASIKANKSDVVITDNVILNSFLEKDDEICLLDENLAKGEIGIGFQLGNTALCDEFNKMLAEFREDGTYDQLCKRWLEDKNPIMPTLDLSQTGRPLRVAVSGSSPPFDYYDNGKIVGFDVELLMRFAQRIKRPLEFQVISFGGLIAAIADGKVDVIADGITITPERAEKVLFSDSHHTGKTVSAILKKNLATTSTSKDNLLHHSVVNGQDTGASPIAHKRSFFASVSDSFYNNLIIEERYMLILKGLWQTLVIAVFAALLGTVLGGLMCFMRMSKKKILSSFAKVYIILMRGIPVLVLLMLLYYAVLAKMDINASLVAIITFALNFAAYACEMFRTSINGVDRGQSEAGIAMGFSKIQTFVSIVMPQALKSVLPVYKGELISLVKMTSVVGYIAVQDLTKASDIIRSRTFDAFFPLIMVAIIYFVLSWGLTALLDRINKIISR